MKNEVVKQWRLEGLSCAMCAAGIEEKIRKMDVVSHATVDFPTKILRISIESNRIMGIEQKLRRLIKRIESDVTLIEVPESSSARIERKFVAHDEHGHKIGRMQRIAMIVAVCVLIVNAVLIIPTPLDLLLYGIAYALVGYRVLKAAVFHIVRGRPFDENLLMSLATIGAWLIGEYPEAVAVMLFYQIGMMMQQMAVDRSVRSIDALLSVRETVAHRLENGELMDVDAASVQPNEFIMVKPGERVPLDGSVERGTSTGDVSAITGESMPVPLSKSQTVLSGTINGEGELLIRVTKPWSDSTFSRILDYVKRASEKKAVTETLMTKLARVYTPIVVAMAFLIALIPPLFIEGALLSDWVYRALIFLVISCPCALVLSIPVGFFGGICAAANHGVLIKGGRYMEALSHAHTMVFDKTGTLSTGQFSVDTIFAEAPWSKPALLYYAAHAECYANHPLAQAMIDAYGKPINTDVVQSFEQKPGLGVKASVDGVRVVAGRRKWMEQNGIIPHENVEELTLIHVALNGVYAGMISFVDTLKPDAKQVLSELKKTGIQRNVMLTGDSKSVAEKTAQELGMDEVYAGLLPWQKVEKLEQMVEKIKKGSVIYVGDGINDAPVLARADAGIAMGAKGADAAIEAADIVLMSDRLSQLNFARTIAKKTRITVWQNIILALGIKAVVLALGAFGLASMWAAVFADVGVSVLAVANGTRIIRYRTDQME